MTEYYVTRLYQFLDRLAANNNRDWFNRHKDLYLDLRQQWLADLDRLIALLAGDDPTLAHQTAQSSAYRIYRDTRFSPDKTPYKTFFSAAITDRGKSAMRAGYYIQLGHTPHMPQGLYGGLWCLDPASLRKMRHAIVDNIEEWETIINDPTLRQAFPQWCSDTLKTIPKGWPRNHPQAHYLRMTNYGLFATQPDTFFLNPDWPAHAAHLLSTLRPLIHFLNYTLDE